MAILDRHAIIKVITVITVFAFMLPLPCCSYKNTEEEILKYADKLRSDELTLSGNYYWSFQLMGGKQLSTHKFYPDSIVYRMEGKVYSTDYTMRKLSYQASINKWIGEDQDKIVYVLFFRDKTDSTVTIYKHKCKSNGLQEAINFGVPDDDATEDHGWNVYALQDDNEEDVLPLAGKYVTHNRTIHLTDSLIIYDNKQFEKLSYHSGERRWVGVCGNEYLQVFFQDLKPDGDKQLNVRIYGDLEVAYKTKYATATWEKYEKQ